MYTTPGVDCGAEERPIEWGMTLGRVDIGLVLFLDSAPVDVEHVESGSTSMGDRG